MDRGRTHRRRGAWCTCVWKIYARRNTGCCTRSRAGRRTGRGSRRWWGRRCRSRAGCRTRRRTARRTGCVLRENDGGKQQNRCKTKAGEPHKHLWPTNLCIHPRLGMPGLLLDTAPSIKIILLSCVNVRSNRVKKCYASRLTDLPGPRGFRRSSRDTGWPSGKSTNRPDASSRNPCYRARRHNCESSNTSSRC